MASSADSRATASPPTERGRTRRGALAGRAFNVGALAHSISLNGVRRPDSSARIWDLDLVVLVVIAVLTALFGHALANVALPGTSHRVTGEQARQIYESGFVLI